MRILADGDVSLKKDGERLQKGTDALATLMLAIHTNTFLPRVGYRLKGDLASFSRIFR